MPEKIFWAVGIATLASLIAGPFFIPLLRILKFGQSIRDEGPKSHLKKAGTPTIGGLIFLVGITVAVLIAAAKPISPVIWISLLAMLGFGLIGFLDDFIKVLRHRNLGLRAWQKLAAQLILALLLAFASVYLGRGTVVDFPFTSLKIDFGVLYYPLIVVLVLAVTNSVNLTDGLDGLAAGCTMFAAIGYLVITIAAVNYETASGGGTAADLPVFAGALAGGCLGFLRFNFYPARVFMGDCGSLALGGALGALAILSKTELILIIIGGVFVIETLSVIIQVISFKTTGKRVLRMAPLHHHFELGGWSEKKVVGVFWSASALCTLLGIGAYIGMFR
ncbi:Phospho-N-acetylmuramoyl-pentapeptide-transferase [Syntrophobotulus glycolicus DSM 8271]|uniref:Phospho-N-acetylmuramoyl-pentapeptide-transferase n=1 Tax=Syntrophobotulus glycolicus (strain DSM 8271 / FlGlyR) TaxID=645991 RepID=F0SZZ6_SYNGF|nr:phospho-N-acetylmuramoyl-pentapeptide-transferase [Syntrophobotulus glycolicus]ADY55007.1 Phospho-N-acetylmuramoyl-pentapeptide-transferase [Syntrophobotulus glycolicus DSM 8271]